MNEKVLGIRSFRKKGTLMSFLCEKVHRCYHSWCFPPGAVGPYYLASALTRQRQWWTNFRNLFANIFSALSKSSSF